LDTIKYLAFLQVTNLYIYSRARFLAERLSHLICTQACDMELCTQPGVPLALIMFQVVSR